MIWATWASASSNSARPASRVAVSAPTVTLLLTMGTARTGPKPLAAAQLRVGTPQTRSA
jgi:hypothetical protein